ncbi:hypothetical protein [Micromonospora tarensis]|uniref:Uncharacterized protein n=1 Tax=Micromonospora tarensis TaxID=2806100 RepID=A0ABS1YQY2_9ACTN|nr:hypothetical protein [Micromonospora tarensis]MBM0279830.1 hypothetical protein [Micromonospora tarensis]
MTGVTEREIETPCGWCGNAIVQPARGRKKRYCERSCRQRAYELRTAERRHQGDVDAGRIRTVPAQRVVERTVQPRRPVTVAQWETALADLAEQLHAGRYPWERHRLRVALAAVLDALGHPPPDSWIVHGTPLTARPDAAPEPPRPAPPAVLDDALAAAVSAVAACAGPDGIDTTLTRLQALTGQPVPLLRDALHALADADLAVLRRHAEPVDDVDALSEHARFQLHVQRGDAAAAV